MNKINIAASFGALALIEVILISLAYIVNQERSHQPKRCRTKAKVHPLANLQKNKSSNMSGKVFPFDNFWFFDNISLGAIFTVPRCFEVV